MALSWFAPWLPPIDERRMSKRTPVPPPAVSPPSAWPKRCPSCRAALSQTAWESLALVGAQEDGAGGLLELRNHRCGSTIAIVIERAPAPVPRLPAALLDDLAAVFRCEANELERCMRTPSDPEASEAARLHGIADALVAESDAAFVAESDAAFVAESDAAFVAESESDASRGAGRRRR
ncbi:MAG: hypothetical protein KF894_01445 [Labilithrix sp.]|nr:hypothetical protein [Labilithrix sp.]